MEKYPIIEPAIESFMGSFLKPNYWIASIVLAIAGDIMSTVEQAYTSELSRKLEEYKPKN